MFMKLNSSRSQESNLLQQHRCPRMQNENSMHISIAVNEFVKETQLYSCHTRKKEKNWKKESKGENEKGKLLPEWDLRPPTNQPFHHLWPDRLDQPTRRSNHQSGS